MKTKNSRKDKVFLSAEGEIGGEKNLHVAIICFILILLSALGLLNLYSAAQGTAFFRSQARNSVLTTLAFLSFGWIIPFRMLIAYAYPLYALSTLLLTIVLLLGRVAGGSQRWITLGPLGFQPSEFAKIAVILTVACFFTTNKQERPYGFKDMYRILLAVGVAFGLIFVQPDFGTAGIVALIALTQICFIRIDVKAIMTTLIASPILAMICWSFFLRDYQKLRVLNLLKPDFDPQNTGYNSLQSLIAVGSGGLWGKGFMQGTQAQLKFLPARHTDFIFSVYAEEHGFWGSLLLFVLFSTLIYLALDIARQAKDSFAALVAVGVAALIFWEFAINVAMVMGIFPVVGVPLPFFSHGSSMLMTICIGLGMLVGIQRHTTAKPKQHTFRSLKL